MEIEICEKCGKPKTFISFLTGNAIPCLCDCEKKRRQEEENRKLREQKFFRIAELRCASLLGDRYSEITFNETDTGENESFDKAYARCKKYCENAQVVYKNGFGIYIYGDKGTGKSHLAACIINELLDQLVPAVFTNFGEIAKIAVNNNALFDKLCNIEFLLIDDLGAQRVKGKDGDLWLQEKVYEVINTRYNNLLPTIFTSNYSIGDLVTKCGLSERTVDRIIEMSSAVICIKGKSKRLEKKSGDLPF